MDQNWINDLLPQFQLAGATLLACRCNNSHSGNLSVRSGDRMLITRSGAMLGSLTAEKLVATSIHSQDAGASGASSEWVVHAKIYERTRYQAIAHGHALAAVAVGWTTDRIVPIDVEGAYYFGGIPVIEHVPATADPGLGAALADALSNDPVVVLRGHGVFAAGDSLERAMQRITSVNDSAEIIIKAAQLGLDVPALRQADYLRFDR